MTDQALDMLMRRVLIDALRKEEESVIEVMESFTPSRKHQRQMEEMMKDPPQIATTSWTPRGKNLGHGWSRRIYP